MASLGRAPHGGPIPHIKPKKFPMTASSDIFHDHVWYMSSQTNAVFYLMGNESFLHTFNLSIICVTKLQ